MPSPRPTLSTPAAGVVVLVGNPRPGSRTRTAGETVAQRVAARLHVTGERTTIDLADLADEILTATHPRADEALRTVAAARLLVVATPVYKGSYTGLLKAFLDLYGPTGLQGVLAVPLVVSASPAHQHAGETHLLPLLAELGAQVPDQALALLEPELADAAAHADLWLDEVPFATAPASTAPAPALAAALRAQEVVR
ncbi:NADPH-dependent FMN reductase [Xylanimonas cellulosilytica DSM 15894]|uniref:NADPH-dependent FMN reductase n=1 Tax=Xylanimonas cellulosilytica (strain DSM 15894 / JCM 12276 / CECT 5975 / KCTC 9989 / LMG 20990 / NBRC 107835 / XIL07) TaxID=446471 RepID=D1BTL8_XYLCX|nr:NAD(P)H-dependent oxidoreductase [Xylanimonas cellulosilytica]ACZ30997.1 NADPH-dependent FMN reductase [Xylanimonas cellulosilytica DSM 15894]